MSLNYPYQKGEKSSLHQYSHNKQRPMYHYLYGSVDGEQHGGESLNVSVDTASSVGTHGKSGSLGGDMDSLLGEALICTDTEDDNASLKDGRGDFEQLLMTNGTNGSAALLAGRAGPQFRKDGRPHCSGPAVCFASFLACLLVSSSIAVVYFIFPPGNHPMSTPSTSSSTGGGSTPTSGGSTSTVPIPSSDSPYKLPFPRADRSDYKDPVENILVTSLFHPDLMYTGKDPSRTFTFPFPTGAFWTNLVLPPTADQGLSYPIFVYPYGYKWSDSLFHISYPYAHRREEPKAIHDYFFPDLKFSCNETVKARHITAFDALSVTLQYETANKGLWTAYLVQGSPYVNMEFGSVTPIIKALSSFIGLDCPPVGNTSYVTDGGSGSSGSSTRQRRRLSYGVCETDLNSTTGIKRVHGVQFIVKTAESWSWIFFSSEPIVLELDTKIPTTIRATEPYNGAFRAAIIPTQGMSLDDLSKSSGVQRLVNHAGIYPIHGEVSWVFSSSQSSSFYSMKTSAQRVGSISLKYLTRSFTPSSGNLNSVKPLLMLALPHHARRLPLNVQLSADAFDLTYRTIKGRMTPVVGATWTYEQVLISPGFDDDSGSNGQRLYLDPAVKSVLLANLKEDINIALPVRTENIYGFGKQTARLAQLAHIASRLVSKNHTSSTNSTNSTGSGNSENDTISSILTQTTKTLFSFLEALLTGAVGDFLVYDANLGGMVTTNGLLDIGADFGNGRYNDHHFHYGYLLYACAILGRLDPSFVGKYRSHVDAIYYDVAYYSNFDSRRRGEGVFFPGARHMNWFDGHSFASGLFPFGNGKSQESSSEAVNCYYGAYLWSIVRNSYGDDPESDISFDTDYARLLLSLEITGAQTYWHMMPTMNITDQSNQMNKTSLVTNTQVTNTRPRIYDDKFAANFMVGNVGMNDAVCTTWFGTEALYVHMINFIPVTAAAGELFGRDFAKIEYDSALSELGEVEMAWRGFVVSNRAISDPNAAWQDAQDLFSRTLDNGLSKTQVLFWIANRKGFVPPSSNSSSLVPSPSPQHSDSGINDLCELNEMCRIKGLVGKCCPTNNGVMLDCC